MQSNENGISLQPNDLEFGDKKVYVMEIASSKDKKGKLIQVRRHKAFGIWIPLLKNGTMSSSVLRQAFPAAVGLCTMMRHDYNDEYDLLPIIGDTIQIPEHVLSPDGKCYVIKKEHK